MTKTYEECLDEVARKKNFKDFYDQVARDHYTNLDYVYKEAALLYGEAKFYEGAELQMQMIKEATKLTYAGIAIRNTPNQPLNHENRF